MKYFSFPSLSFLSPPLFSSSFFLTYTWRPLHPWKACFVRSHSCINSGHKFYLAPHLPEIRSSQTLHSDKVKTFCMGLCTSWSWFPNGRANGSLLVFLAHASGCQHFFLSYTQGRYQMSHSFI